jgi:hypothetical protein
MLSGVTNVSKGNKFKTNYNIINKIGGLLEINIFHFTFFFLLASHQGNLEQVVQDIFQGKNISSF